MFAGIKKRPGTLLISEDDLVGYKNPDPSMLLLKKWEVLTCPLPGFYLGWDFMIYMAPSKRVFTASKALLHMIDVHKDTGVLLQKYSKIPIQFATVPPEDLYSELFLL
jgi:hypothetical protein